ncbi:MAG TPA: hypothetical protein V6C81_13440 [Planktothrix sp.]|jgi:hypothetical protein
MREHQIVISLKPEHFQQVQRLARADGSKSVSVFVRQRLLSSLGLDGQEAVTDTTSAPDWQHIAGQLRRLHRELQVFIAESMANNQLADEAEPPKFIVPEENFVSKGGPILVEYNPAHQRYVEQRQALNLQQPTNTGAAATPTKVPPLDVSSDEMEQLADRAFAISPRLGAIESAPVAPAKYDPLQDLLEEKLVRKAEEHEQGDEEVDDQLESEEVDESSEEIDAELQEEILANAAADEEDATVARAAADELSGTAYGAASDSAQIADEENDCTDDDESDEATAHINDTDDEESDPGQTPPPPQPPPISGGPPPRKSLR